MTASSRTTRPTPRATFAASNDMRSLLLLILIGAVGCAAQETPEALAPPASGSSAAVPEADTIDLDSLFVGLDARCLSHRVAHRGQKRRWVHENRVQSRIVVGITVEKQQSPVGGDRHSMFVVEIEPAAPLETLLLQNHAGPALELAEVNIGK